MFELKFIKEDSGFCRIYFSFIFNENKKLCCLQKITEDKYELLSCSKDEEPYARLKTSLFNLPEPFKLLKLAH